jgi:hypothetical protein
MRALSGNLLLGWLLLVAGSVLGEEAEIWVFTLKDGKQVEAISHASAMKEGEKAYSVTTTTGEKMELLGNEVVRKESVKKDISKLPEHARKRLEAQQKVRREWAARAAAEQKADEEKRRMAFVRGAELAKEGKVVREAELAERIVRQRCATLQNTQQRAASQIRAAQEDIRRACSNYDRQRRLDHNRNNNNRRSNSDRYSQDRIRDAERRLEDATKRSKESASKLTEEKKKLAEAQKKVAEAKRKYEEARKRFKQPVSSTADAAGEKTESTKQAPKKTPQKAAQKAQPKPAASDEPDARSTVTENIDQGKFIKLADDSFWQIRPEHRISSASWKPEQQVSIFGCADPFYPYRLVNGATKMAVNARKME